MRTQYFLLSTVFLLLSCTQDKMQEARIINETLRDYRQAWLDDNSERVMSHISVDIFLFQAGESAAPIRGKEAVREFWFPESDIAYPIYEYEITNEQISVSNDLAIAQGISHLGWYTLDQGVAKDSSRSVSEFITVLRKEEGQWKIYRQIFNRKATDYSY